MSDSLQLHRLLPARFLCPWNSSDKNTGVGCHSLLQGMFLTQVSCIVGKFFTIWATREALYNVIYQLYLKKAGGKTTQNSVHSLWSKVKTGKITFLLNMKNWSCLRVCDNKRCPPDNVNDLEWAVRELTKKPTWAAAGGLARAGLGAYSPLSRLWGRLGMGWKTPRRARSWPRKDTDNWKSTLKNRLL